MSHPDEASLKSQFTAREPTLNAWGRHVVATIVGETAGAQGPAITYQIPPDHRVKEIPSFLEKALYRGKNYADPINDIEDQVGARFVVLLASQVKTISELIGRINIWEARQARDFEAERVLRPQHFDYQSDHFIVRNRRDMEIDGVTVPAGTPCEVQVRTLLQHAYAQLSHDLTYKRKIATSAAVNRSVARSMALIETTDELFQRAAEATETASEEMVRVLAECRKLYVRFLEKEPIRSQVEMLILDAYHDKLSEISLGEMLAQARSGAYRDWATNHSSGSLGEMAVMIAVFTMVGEFPRVALASWPLYPAILEGIFTARGASMPV